MKPSGLITKVIVDFHNEPISKVDVDLRTWPLAIDTDDRSGKAIRAGNDPVDAPVIPHRL